MSGFPNVETQFRGGERRGKPRPPIGKRRARKLKAALAVAEAVHGPSPLFEGTSVDYLRAVMRGEIKPDPVQMAAAMALRNIDAPTLSASMTASVNQPGENAIAIDFRWADAGDATSCGDEWRNLSDEDLHQRIAEMQRQLADAGPHE